VASLAGGFLQETLNEFLDELFHFGQRICLRRGNQGVKLCALEGMSLLRQLYKKFLNSQIVLKF
jgi:hypothetical protein